MKNLPVKAVSKILSVGLKKGFFDMKDRYTSQEEQSVIADVGVLEIKKVI
ncbi:MAG: hypothetical protein NHB15_21625 [Methanosarcina barkeri]|nr:hypothetical protein [Methanosarcina sp. ERenArc_MAG2]